ncbi:MAG: hypothetical protein MJZ56_04805 [Bacteroidales bacterium]|nr:hypothetical protein [Bacteroidales bacterium]
MSLNDYRTIEELYSEKVKELIKSFYFLIPEGYDIERLSIGCMHYPSLCFRHYLTKQAVDIAGGDFGTSDYECLITISNGKWGLFGRKHKIFYINDYFAVFNSPMVKGRDYSPAEYADFIEQNLMPVIRGEMWIDELLIKLGKTPPVIEKTKERYVRSE